MNDLIKSIHIGAVEFFGILVPGLLFITMCGIGIFFPLWWIVIDFSNSDIGIMPIDLINSKIFMFIILILSYVLGYVLRLASPDQLDKISAKKVIQMERKNGTDISRDGWPYNPGDNMDKYPYFNFKEYLIVRNHRELTFQLVTWGKSADENQNSETGSTPNPTNIKATDTKRSKTTINKMKMEIRCYCPELIREIDSKEGHIRLMAGSWAAFQFFLYPLIGIWTIELILILLPSSDYFATYIPPIHHNYSILLLCTSSLSGLIYAFMHRIEKYFHYRRINELFHIVQAAYIAKERRQRQILLLPVTIDSRT